MPNPKVHQKAKEKIESTQKQMTNCSPSLAFMPDDEFVELLWENGEIVMKGQSNRAKKCSLSNCFPSDAPKVQEKDEGDAVIPKTGRYSNLSAVMNDFSPPGLVQDDEMVPWLNDPVHDSLHSDYFAEFFTELTGTNLNSLSGQSNAIVTDSSNNSQVGIDGNVVSAHSGKIQEHRNPSEVVVGVSEPTTIGSIKSSSAKLGQTSVSNLRPRVSEFITNNNSINRESVPSNLIPSPVSATGVPNTVAQKNDLSSIRPQEPSENRVLMNFSHFLRPAGLVKANMQGMGTASASFSNADRLKRNEEVSVSGSNFIVPSLVVSTNGSEGLVGFQTLPASVSAKVDSNSCQEPPQELISVKNSEITYQEDASRSNDDNNNNSSRGDALHQSLSAATSVAAQRSESEKVLEPVVASSSMCSGNSAGGVSNDLRHAMKRKAGELEELEYQSEDVEDESTDVKKSTKSAKRSRTAEVHNLSERRRRDRINEKMRALQELIPNCNKVDKASMLDEAIEYIKTLQLQMQMMSMGSRFCMPTMMLPAGIQHLGTPAMPRFSPLGVGMAMGMGAAFGMGIPEDLQICMGCKPLTFTCLESQDKVFPLYILIHHSFIFQGGFVQRSLQFPMYQGQLLLF
eukprot:TRINITY_DN1519_c1_g1_i16.p1 TRINITY_DN1519_c1_g1~~TRINITY_DN1519_c1_g1_i16.p1  ORF type:complete len:627 (-),score=146.94 TRINITY_DN1519_c1_g1_i16:288-2168(-)